MGSIGLDTKPIELISLLGVNRQIPGVNGANNSMESGMTSRRPKAALRNLLKLESGISARTRMLLESVILARTRAFHSFLLVIKLFYASPESFS